MAVTEDGRLEDYFVERTGSKHLVGSIYKGKVDSIVTGIGAAFIDLGLEKNGFLYVADLFGEISDSGEILTKESVDTSPAKISEVLKKGQELLVQITKEPWGTKGPRITPHIALPGRYLVLMPHEKRLGISKKISGEKERKQIRGLLNELRLPKNVGFIVRTAGAKGTKKQFDREAKYLLNLWTRIKRRIPKVRAPHAVYEEYDLVLRMVRDFLYDDTGRVVVDSKAEYRKIVHFLKSLAPHLIEKVKLHRGPKSLFETEGIEREIAKIYQKKLFLKGKGYIVIEQTEGLIAIDVNTGSFAGKKNLEETAYVTNLKAAEEIARQIRLRDLGGIIVIDFIDMDMPKHRQAVFNAIEQAVRRDKAKTNILRVSHLGLVEMTRQRMRKSLQSIMYQDCPYCHGSGSVKSAVTISIEVARKIRDFLGDKRHKIRRNAVTVEVHPQVAKSLHENVAFVRSIQKECRCRITIKDRSDFHLQDVRVS